MVPSSTMSSKGQITVPREIRRRLGLKTGDRVEFVVEDQRTIIRPARAENPFVKYIGTLPAFSSARKINAWVRRLRADEGPRKPRERQSTPTSFLRCGPSSRLLRLSLGGLVRRRLREAW